MGRPKVANPRSERLVLRMTAPELAQVRADAASAGVAVAEFARGRVLLSDPVEKSEVGAAVAELASRPRGPVAQEVAARLASESRPPKLPPDSKPQTAWDRHQQNESRKLSWFCPTPLCQEHGAKGARCPAHGVAMDVRGRA